MLLRALRSRTRSTSVSNHFAHTGIPGAVVSRGRHSEPSTYPKDMEKMVNRVSPLPRKKGRSVSESAVTTLDRDQIAVSTPQPEMHSPCRTTEFKARSPLRSLFNTIHINDLPEFERYVIHAPKGVIVLVHYYDEDCEVCQEVTPALEAAAIMYDKVLVAKVDATTATPGFMDIFCRRVSASCLPLTVAIGNGDKLGLDLGIMSGEREFHELIEQADSKMESRRRRCQKWWAEEQRCNNTDMESKVFYDERIPA